MRAIYDDQAVEEFRLPMRGSANTPLHSGVLDNLHRCHFADHLASSYHRVLVMCKLSRHGSSGMKRNKRNQMLFEPADERPLFVRSLSVVITMIQVACFDGIIHAVCCRLLCVCLFKMASSTCSFTIFSISQCLPIVIICTIGSNLLKCRSKDAYADEATDSYSLYITAPNGWVNKEITWQARTR